MSRIEIFYGSIASLLILAAPCAALGQSPKEKMAECLQIDDMTKERLDCFDAIIPPAPKNSTKKAKAAADCRFLKEEDERLTCFDRFTENEKKPAKRTKATKSRPQD